MVASFDKDAIDLRQKRYQDQNRSDRACLICHYVQDQMTDDERQQAILITNQYTANGIAKVTNMLNEYICDWKGETQIV